MNRISQYLVYPIVRFFNIFFFDVEFKNPEGFKPIIGKPALIIANHISYYDSFLLRLNHYSVGLSLYFMGAKKFKSPYMRFMWITGIVPVVYKLFGVFLVYPGLGIEKNLEMPRRILSKNNQIFIFPEGSVNKTGILKPFKLGSATLSSMTSAPVLPVSYREVCESGKRRKIMITLGEVMNFTPGMNPEEINKQLEDRVRQMLS